MPRARPKLDPAQTERAIVAAWRRLTGGKRVRDPDRRTVVACSGGADSAALLIALGRAAPASLRCAHVSHDLRPAAEVAGDREAVRSLAAQLGVVFEDTPVHVAPGNAEGEARRVRYAALEAAAACWGAAFVATGHHADDQLETVLMRLARGTGPRGLAGVHEARTLSGAVTLIRPMLRVTRANAEALCAEYGYRFRVDPTNTDRTRLRARFRHDVLPTLRALAPGISVRAANAAQLAAEASAVVEDAARACLEAAQRDAGTLELDRAMLRRERPITVATCLRLAMEQVTGGAGLDRATARETRKAAEHARSSSGERRVYRLGSGVVTIFAGSVRIEHAQGRRAMSDGASKKVWLVGHCGPDSSVLASMARRAIEGAEVAQVNDDAALADAKTDGVLLVNRQLDGAFSTESGIELIRALSGDASATAPMLLISNFADAQEAAEAAGAEPGFGKADVNDPESLERLRKAARVG